MKLNVRRGFNNIITWIICIVLLNFVSSEEYLGDFCTLQRINATGQCKLLSSCPRAIEDLRSQGISPQTCGFEGVRPIVCCVENIPSPTPSSNEGGIARVGTKSREKCKEYFDEYGTYDKPIAGFEGPTYPCVNTENLLITNKARPQEFPSMAAIGYDGESAEKVWLCSGVLISEQFILTAAHCLYYREHNEPKYVRIGDLVLDTDTDDARPQEFNIVETFKHPNYKPPSLYNDIALLKMDRAARFNLYARPACLDTNDTNPIPNSPPQVVGWGEEDYTSEISPHLLRGYRRYVSHNECENSYKNVNPKLIRFKNGILDETQICASPPTSNQDTCGLHTGALQVFDAEKYCMYNVVGITSFGRACGIADVPDVFTRVSGYIEWIEEIVWPL